MHQPCSLQADHQAPVAPCTLVWTGPMPQQGLTGKSDLLGATVYDVVLAEVLAWAALLVRVGHPCEDLLQQALRHR